MAIGTNGLTFFALLKMIFHLRDAFDSGPDPNKVRLNFPENHNAVETWDLSEKKTFHDEISSSHFQVWEVFSQKFNESTNKGGACLIPTGK